MRHACGCRRAYLKAHFRPGKTVAGRMWRAHSFGRVHGSVKVGGQRQTLFCPDRAHADVAPVGQGLSGGPQGPQTGAPPGQNQTRRMTEGRAYHNGFTALNGADKNQWC